MQSWCRVDDEVKRSCLKHIHYERITNGLILCMEWLLYIERTEQRLKNEQMEEDVDIGRQKRFWSAEVEILDEERPQWYLNLNATDIKHE